MRAYDVVVVGAGPAGATVARELALKGVRTALLERAALPRYKVCAGGIPGRTTALLPFAIDAVIEDAIYGVAVTHRGGGGFERRDSQPFASMVMRDRFDQLLTDEAAAAGAEVIDRCVARSIERRPEGFSIQTNRGELCSTLLVGADGVNSRVARSTGLGRGLAEGCAIEAEVRAPGELLRRWRGLVNVDLGHRPSGYGWLFPKDRLLSVGIVLPRAAAASLRHELTAYLSRLGLASAETERVMGQKVLFRRGGEPIAGAGVLLIGDAAGLVDEFTEEGIYYAIRSGQIAARFLERAITAGHTWLGAYQSAIDRELMGELRAARTISRLYYGSLAHAPRAMMFVSRRTGYLWRAFFRVQRGESSYRDELRRARVVQPLARILLR